MMARVRAASLSALLSDPPSDALLTALREHIRTRRWFRGKARAIAKLAILDHVALQAVPRELALAFVRLDYDADEPETYVLALALAPAPATHEPALCEVEISDQVHAVLCDPSGSDELSQRLLELLVGEPGRIHAFATDELKARLAPGQPALAAHVPSGEQSNTTVFYGREFMLKLFRQLEAGENPDVEICRFLWSKGYHHVPEPLGHLRYQSPELDATLGIVQRFVPSAGLAWDVMLAALQRSFEHALAQPERTQPALPPDDLLDSAEQVPPPAIAELLGDQLAFVRRLGQRSAELHAALAQDRSDPAFAPEPFDESFRRSLVQGAQGRIQRTFELLTRQLPALTEEDRRLAHVVLSRRDALQRELEAVRAVHVQASRIRVHGDYHLGQVLCSADDVTILDFEGEPAQPIALRRQKLSALYDVAGMLRSFHYAATVALRSERWSAGDRAALSSCAEAWYRWTSALFLGAYLKSVRDQGSGGIFLPGTPAELRALLALHLIDKSSYELGYELNNRPAWVGVPLTGLLSLADRR